jgi:hypothetical protein
MVQVLKLRGYHYRLTYALDPGHTGGNIHRVIRTLESRVTSTVVAPSPCPRTVGEGKRNLSAPMPIACRKVYFKRMKINAVHACKPPPVCDADWRSRVLDGQEQGP